MKPEIVASEISTKRVILRPEIIIRRRFRALIVMAAGENQRALC